VASVAARHRLSLDAIEDLRIAIDEACAQILRAGGTTITAQMRGVADGIEVLCSSDAKVDGWPPEGFDRGFAAQVLSGLADTVAWETAEDGGPAIRIGKRAVGSTQT
jgi:serine/threonine-protein kinase RsbW